MLATPEDLASLLQLDYAALPDETKATLLMLVELATAKVQRAAGGQRIVDATDTAVIDVEPGYCDLYLPLPQLPVRSVDAVTVEGQPATDWRLANQMLWRPGGWSHISRPTQVKVTYSHGYLDGSQWLELAKDACLSLAALGWNVPAGATSEAIDDYRVTYEDADARMVVSDRLRQAIADAYGVTAYVTESR